MATERKTTHVVVFKETKKIIDEIKSSSGLPLVTVTDRALRRGLRVLYKQHLPEESIAQLQQ